MWAVALAITIGEHNQLAAAIQENNYLVIRWSDSEPPPPLVGAVSL
jgi:hypothetical protein